MEKIQSFRVDHTKIGAGIYVSRIDGDITTYDMRFRRPNMGDYLDNLEMHSLEHMFATYVRNSEIKDDVIYFGPMGCRTGFYLLVRNANNSVVLDVTKKVLSKIIDHDESIGMYGASEIECGNYRELSLASAKKVAKEYLDVLNTANNTFEYQN